MVGCNWTNFVTDEQAKELKNQTILSAARVLKEIATWQKPTYIIPGNWDTFENKLIKVILKANKNLILVHNTIKENKDFQIVGYGKTSGPEITEFNPKQISEFIKLYATYEKILQKATTTKPLFLLSHVPPYKTKLDTLIYKQTQQKQSKELLKKNSNYKKIHVGSQLVRRLIDEFQPKLAISGHMHENFGTQKIKQTLCINAGLAKKIIVTTHDLQKQARKLSKLPKTDPKTTKTDTLLNKAKATNIKKTTKKTVNKQRNKSTSASDNKKQLTHSSKTEDTSNTNQINHNTIDSRVNTKRTTVQKIKKIGIHKKWHIYELKQ
jgi:Icc-related predicted phosphoesterase